MASTNQTVDVAELERFIQQLENITGSAPDPKTESNNENADNDAQRLMDSLSNYQQVSPLLDDRLNQAFQAYHGEAVRLQAVRQELLPSLAQAANTNEAEQKPGPEPESKPEHEHESRQAQLIALSAESHDILVDFRQFLQDENVLVKLKDMRNELYPARRSYRRTTASVLNTILGIVVVYPLKKICSL